MYVSISRLRVASERVPELIDAFRGRSRDVERHDGFVDLQVMQSDRDAGEVLMVSRWRDRDCFTAYMKSEDHRRSHERIAPDLAAAAEAALNYVAIGFGLVAGLMSAVRLGVEFEVEGVASAGFAFNACSSSAAGRGRLRA